MAILTAVLFPLFTRGIDPLFQIRAAEMGQALMEEIMAKPYDETTPVGGLPPCAPCSASLGADGETRTTFDDVDDYDSYCGTLNPVRDVNNAIPTGFENYRMAICVDYDGNYDEAADSNQAAKLITIDVYPPQGGQPATALTDPAIRFRAHRSNF